MGPIQDIHKTTYKANMVLALQQTMSKYDDTFSYAPELQGEKAQFLEIYGAAEAVTDLGRKADTPDIDSQVEPVWVTPRQIAWGRLMEVEDVIKAVMNPQSQFIRVGAAAMVRKKDSILRDAIFGPRIIGKNGSTTSSWAGDTVAVGVGHSDGVTAIGMNVKKLLRGQRLFSQREVDIDMEQITCITNAQGMEELYNDIMYVNTDYRAKSVIDSEKQVRRVLNIEIKIADGPASKLADYDGSTYTGAMYCKSGMHWGEFKPLVSDIPTRADKMNRPHPFSEHWVGASRGEDYKVVKILNKK